MLADALPWVLADLWVWLEVSSSFLDLSRSRVQRYRPKAASKTELEVLGANPGIWSLIP